MPEKTNIRRSRSGGVLPLAGRRAGGSAVATAGATAGTGSATGSATLAAAGGGGGAKGGGGTLPPRGGGLGGVGRGPRCSSPPTSPPLASALVGRRYLARSASTWEVGMRYDPRVP
ncbi:MAG: hypothetical protein EHM63_08000 [Actinobacteria bacterium]|nr:MAG: hypothetical protein EHM63_08000 [Actinomycetota bacterium]